MTAKMRGRCWNTAHFPRALAATAAAVILAVCVSPWVPAGAAADHHVFEISTATGPPGTEIGMTGQCIVGGAPGNHVWASLTYLADNSPDYVVRTSGTTAGDGSFDRALVVPPEAPGGSYRLSITCAMDDAVGVTEDFDFVVTDAGPPPGPHEVTFYTPPSTTSPGSTLDVSGKCMLFGTYPAGADIDLSGGDPLTSVRQTTDATADGSFTATLSIPAAMPLGIYSLYVGCRLENVTFAYTRFDVAVAAEDEQTRRPPPRQVLPNAGGGISPAVVPVGLAVAVAGAALVAMGRRGARQ